MKINVRFIPNDKDNPPGKLADAELHFTHTCGPLDGLKLVGFSVWERRNGGRNVTFPARQYSVNGERRSFALLRPMTESAAQDRLRDLILDAYRAQEETTELPDDNAPLEGPHTGQGTPSTDAPSSGEQVAALIQARATGEPVKLTNGDTMQTDGRVTEANGFIWAADPAVAIDADKRTVHLQRVAAPAPQQATFRPF